GGGGAGGGRGGGAAPPPAARPGPPPAAGGRGGGGAGGAGAPRHARHAGCPRRGRGARSGRRGGHRGRAGGQAVRVPGLPAAGRVAGGGGRPRPAALRRRGPHGAAPPPAGGGGGGGGVAGARPRRPPAAPRGTGRIFTGDRSGDVLVASLYRCGLAAQPTSVAAGDGQRLIRARMVAAARCAPPANKPTVAERDSCAPWLSAEYAKMAASVRVVVCLGAFAWQATWPVLRSAGLALPRPRPAFGHGVEVRLAAAGDGHDRDDGHDGRDADQVLLIGCYHPSQQNTFTGRVTPAMLDAVFRRARSEAGL